MILNLLLLLFRYDANARERQRQIKRLEVKKNFHKEENEKAQELVEERLKSYLSITQVGGSLGQYCVFLTLASR